MKKNKIDKIYNLIGIYEDDLWNIKKCGFKNVEQCIKKNTVYEKIDFSNIKNEVIKRELKYFIFNRLRNFKGGYDSLRGNYLIIFKWVIKYLEINCENMTSLFEVTAEDTNSFKEFLIMNNVKIIYRKIDYVDKIYNAPIVNSFKRVKEYLKSEYNETCSNSPDILYIKDLNLSSHRLNPSRDIKAFKFSCFDNEYNKHVIKEYINYLCYETEISLGFIYSKLSSIKELMFKIGDKRIDEMTRKDIEDYKSYLLKRNIEVCTFNKKIVDISNFFEYGIQKKLWNQNYIYWEYDLINMTLKIKGKTVEADVIEQILKNKDRFSRRDFTIFLILYCCGMRISEVCMLKKDCLKRDINGYFIIFYCQKMKKEVSHPIPKYLYEYLKNYEDEIVNHFGEDQEYIFTNKNGDIVRTETFKDSMKRSIIDIGIKNSDGTDYIFRPHEYRHTFATSLLERNIPFSVVQKLLHHNSPEMSLIYTQISDSRKREKYVEFVNILGEKSSNLFEDKKKDEKVYEVQWLKNNLKAQVLPNGFCSLPVSLGVCPYANACLTCDYFKSTKGHIPILKKQLIRTEALIEILKEKNLNEQLEVNLEVKKNLKRIIGSIEEGDKDAVT